MSGKSGLLVTEVRRRVRSRVEQFAAIRRDHRVDGLSIRALADKHGVHRRTVRQALESAVPPPRKTPARVAPRLEPFKMAIDSMLPSVRETVGHYRSRRRWWTQIGAGHGGLRRAAPSANVGPVRRTPTRDRLSHGRSKT